MNKVVFSHKSDDWSTPSDLYSFFIDNGFIDPCPLFSNDNNLGKVFHGEKIFINPPYSKICDWVDYAIDLSLDNEVFLLIPCRTDTKYFYKLSKHSDVIYFIKGRLKFSDKGCAPFPSCLVKLGCIGEYYFPVAKFVSKVELFYYLERDI